MFQDISNNPKALALSARRAAMAKKPGWWGEFQGTVFQAPNGLVRWAVAIELDPFPEDYETVWFFRTKDDALNGWGPVWRDNFASWNPTARFHLIKLTEDRPS